MKKIIFCLYLLSFNFFYVQAQNVIELSNGAGVELQEEELASLELFATNTIPAFSEGNFKIIDASFYTFNDEMGKGREEAIWDNFKTEAKTISPNHILLGRQYFEDGDGFKLWIHLEVDIEDLECYDVDFKNEITEYIESTRSDMVEWYDELTLGIENNTFQIESQVAELAYYKLNKVCCIASFSRSSCDLDDLDPQDLKEERDLKFYILGQLQCKLFGGNGSCNNYEIASGDPLSQLTVDNLVESSNSKFYDQKDKLPYFGLIHIYLSESPNGMVDCNASPESGPDKTRWVVSEHSDIDDYLIPVVEYNVGQFTIVMPKDNDFYAILKEVSEQVNPNLSKVLEDIKENGGHLSLPQLNLLYYTTDCNFLNIKDEAKKYTLLEFIVDLRPNPFLKIIGKYIEKYPVFIVQLYENIGYNPETTITDKRGFFEYQSLNLNFTTKLLEYEFYDEIKQSFFLLYIKDYLTSYVEIEEGDPICIHVNGTPADEILYLPYEVDKFLTFHHRNFFFELNADDNRINIKTANVLTADFDHFADLKPFEPVVITAINVQNFGSLTGLIPAILLPIVDKFMSSENEFNAAMVGIDIVSTVSVVGNLGKLKYLRRIAKAKAYFTGIEITATISNNIVKYSSLIKSEDTKKRISIWLSLIEIGSAIGNGFSPLDIKKIQDEGESIAKLLDNDPLANPLLISSIRALSGGHSNLLFRIKDIIGNGYLNHNLYKFVLGLDEVNDAIKISRLSALLDHSLNQVAVNVKETAKIAKFADDLVDPDKGLGLVIFFNVKSGGVKAWEKAFEFPNSSIKTGVLERLSTKYKNVLDDIKNINEEFLESANNHLDLGGHNRYPDAVKIVTDPLDYNGLPIKNHLEGQVETFLPKFDSGSMSKLTAESFPVTPQIATDMKRVIQDGGEIGIMNSQSFVDQYVALFDDITGSVSYGTFTDDFGIDYITAVISVAK